MDNGVRNRLVILLTIVAVLGGGLAYLFSQINLIPRPASLERESIDNLLKILFSIASVIFALVIVFYTDAILFSRRRDTREGPSWMGLTPLELTWTLIPLFIVVSLGTLGGIILNRITQLPPPQSELEVDVLAFRFGWQFSYPQYGIKSFELDLPVNRPVVLHIESKDVVHSFWVPEFGPKQDAVPGMTTELRLTPINTGSYQVMCSQLCGYGHTYMTAPVVVSSENDFQKWVQEQQSLATPSPTVTPTTTPASITINLVAQDLKFNLDLITMPAGAQVTINFDNKDNVPHNFALYTDDTAQTVLFRGDIIGQSTITYIFKAPLAPGTYFFRCDVHPTTMTGKFITTQ